MSLFVRYRAFNMHLLQPGCISVKRFQSTQADEQTISGEQEFRVLNLRQVKSQPLRRRFVQANRSNPSRTQKMAVDQEWSSVWPGPRTFHPSSVPLPIRQGYTPKGQAPPGKFANTELMKIPNFLHLTPPVIKKQCEALKQFCTPWPKGLETEEEMKAHFPVEVITSDYVHGLPTIRNPLSRIVSIRLNLENLPLDQHAKDKFLRLVGERYDEETNVLTIVTDRCPLKQQNYEYAQYLLAALFHESWNVEPWEATKVEADMEYYDWNKNKSKDTVTGILNWNIPEKNVKAPDSFGKSVERLINEGENEQNLLTYKEEVLALLNLPKYNSSDKL